MENQYWIFDWLAENHIGSGAEAKRLLPKYRVIDSLRARAEMAGTQTPAPRPSTTSIVAGAGIDLSSGGMICSSPKCMRKQVDRLLKHVWHYFDTIVVDDVLTPVLLEEWSGTKKELINTIVSHLEPLIYLNKIGAAELVRFLPRERCLEHWKENAQTEQLNKVLDSEEDVVKYLIRSGVFYYKKVGTGSTCYWLKHPDLPSVAGTEANGRSEDTLKRHLAQMAYSATVSYLTTDVRAARTCELPLGSVLALEGKFLCMSGPPSVEDVLFRLKLPILEQITTKDLVNVRSQEQEAFHTFRNALRKAAAERLKLGDSQSAAALAEQIRLDVIEPSLDRIRLRLARWSFLTRCRLIDFSFAASH